MVRSLALTRNLAAIGAAALAATMIGTTSCSLAVDLSELNSQTGKPCASGLADCNGDPKDGCEQDIAGSPENCGACGHSCLGGECAAGFCTARVVTTLKDIPVDMTGDADHLYWIDGQGGVLAYPKQGGALATLRAALGVAQTLPGIGADASYVYFNDVDALGRGSVWQVAKDGGAAPKRLYSDTRSLYALRVSKGTIFFGDGNNSVLAMNPTDKTPHVVASLPRAPLRLAVDGATIYVATLDLTGLRGALTSIDVTSGKPTVLVQEDALVFDVAVTGGWLYWLYVKRSDYTHGKVRRLKLGCSGCQPEDFATNQSWPFRLGHDAGNVYWTNLDFDPLKMPLGVNNTGTVARAPIDGAPRLLAQQLVYPSVVVPDTTVVWFADAHGLQQVVQ